MYKVTVEKIFFPLLAFLLVISLGFVNEAEASSGDDLITNEENASFTTEVLNPIENKMQAQSQSLRWYFFKGDFINTLYTAKTMTVASGGSFYFDFEISSKHSSGYVDVTVQRKTLTGYSDIKTFSYDPNTGAKQDLTNLTGGEYRLKIHRTNSLSTSVDGQMGSY